MKYFSAKILCFFIAFLIWTPSISAQTDSPKPFTTEQISKARKGFKKWISESNIVALVKVGPNSEKAIDCFYGDDGKTIFTAVKIKLIHNYTENMRTINGEAIVIVEGGIIGMDNQYYFDIRPSINDINLLRLDKSIENKSSKFMGLPAYEATSTPMIFQSGDGTLHWKTSAFQFESTVEFDTFVYKALKRTPVGKKKKRCGLFRIFN